MNQDITSANQVDKIPKPFWGNWEGLTYMTSVFGRYVECQGNCTHLGLFTAVVNYEVTYNDPNNPTGGSLVNGTAVMTAANGDIVNLAFSSGSWWFQAPVNPMVAFTCNLTVTGGTGRFEGATGTLEGSGTQNFYGPTSTQPQEVWFNWTGQIQY
jgi:hypothetical protein